MRFSIPANQHIGRAVRPMACLVAFTLLAPAISTVHAERPGTVKHTFSVLPQEDTNGDGVVDGGDHGLRIIGFWVADADGKLTGEIGDISGLFAENAGTGDDVMSFKDKPATLWPMLADFVDREDGTRWDLHNNPDAIRSGIISIRAATTKSGPSVVIFLNFRNKAGDGQIHRVEGDAIITGPPDGADPDGANFPLGLEVGETYTVDLFNWVLKHDTGSKKLAYQGPVEGGLTTIEFMRTE